MSLLKKILTLPQFFKNNYLEELLFIKRFGLPKKEKTFLEIRQEKFKHLPSPVFFLSTGRCGTKWFYYLLKKTKEISVFHEPTPNLGYQGVMLYNELMESNFELNPKISDLYKEIFLVAREQYLRYSVKTNKRYIETNNQITFFAPILAKLFPSAIFVHLYRHPGEFVRSGLRRNFYGAHNLLDKKRILPKQRNKYYNSWEKLSQIEKIAWLWTETNEFIETFKKTIDCKQIFEFNFNEINEKNISQLLEKLNISFPKQKITKLLDKKVNKQKTGRVNSFGEWEKKNQKKVLNICQNLINNYYTSVNDLL